jgi:hypothetical protein
MSKTFFAAAMLALPALMMAQKPKSQKEVDAINAVIQSKTPDDRMAAVDNLVQKFADTEFKVWALNAAANAAQMKKDVNKVTFYGDMAIKADPKDAEAMLAIASTIATSTREFDLDRDEKLAKMEKYVKDALAVLPSLAKPNYLGQATPEQWEGLKKDMMGQAHETLGIAALVRKKPDVAAQEFKIATETAATMEPATFVRLAGALNDTGKPDEALAALAKIPADANPAIKQFVDAEKARAEKLKTGKK